MTNPREQFQEGMNMYWPLKFNLLLDPFRFANENDTLYYD